jgi:YYY domain-containing protein
MADAIVWWLTIEILGLVALPVAAVLLRPLPDRGYAVSKVLGILLTGWLAYTLAMMKVLQFGRGSLALCVVVLAAFSGWLLYRNDRALLSELVARFRTGRFIRYIVTAEVLFALSYTIWAVVRAFNPDIFAQEKFMDFGFLNAILKSGNFPPNDMWFAGHSINYYYFGYVLMAGLTALSGVPSQVAFNLANVTLFSLTALGSFGFVYNLIAGGLARFAAAQAAEAPARVLTTVPRKRAQASAPQPANEPVPARKQRARAAETPVATAQATVAVLDKKSARPQERQINGRDNGRPAGPAPQARPRGTPRSYETVDLLADEAPRIPIFLSPYIYAVLAALMVVAMGNLTTMFGVKNTANDMQGNGWSFCFNCQKPTSFDWWGPSRIVQDYRTTQEPGQAAQKQKVGYETINEFPAFSFLLADMHPHVLALPLVLLAVTAAYALSRRKVVRATSWRDGLPRGVEQWTGIVIVGIIVGSLYTTNTWDYPTYLLVVLAGLGLPYLAFRGGWRRFIPWVVQSVLVVVLSLVSFLLFHLTFKSLLSGQAAPLPDNLANMPVVGWLLQKLSGLLIINTADKTILGFLVIFGIFLTAIVVWLLYEFFAPLWSLLRDGEAPTRTLAILGGAIVAMEVLAFLLQFPLLGFLLPLVVLAGYVVRREPGATERNLGLVMFSVGALIAIGIEVVFLRDNFQMRMNTLFKFYYQIWVLWALVAAYGLWRTLYAAFRVVEERVGRGRVVATSAAPVGARVLAVAWAGVFGLLVLSGLMYSYYGTMSRQVGAQPNFRGLDGSTHFKGSAPGDYDAIYWLKDHATGSDVLLECCSTEYETHAGRMSAFTGVPTLLAWDNSHESLWRSGQPDLAADIPRRRNLINSIYQGVDPSDHSPLTAQRLLELLRQNGVDYVVAGASERNEPGAQERNTAELLKPEAEAVFKQALTTAFTSGTTVVYQVPAAPAGGQETNTQGPVAHR